MNVHGSRPGQRLPTAWVAGSKTARNSPWPVAEKIATFPAYMREKRPDTSFMDETPTAPMDCRCEAASFATPLPASTAGTRWRTFYLPPGFLHHAHSRRPFSSYHVTSVPGPTIIRKRGIPRAHTNTLAARSPLWRPYFDSQAKGYLVALA